MNNFSFQAFLYVFLSLTKKVLCCRYHIRIYHLLFCSFILRLIVCNLNCTNCDCGNLYVVGCHIYYSLY